MTAPLRFPRRVESENGTARALTTQQVTVSQALGIFREVESPETPSPALIGKWLRDLFGGDAGLLLFALNLMANRGQLLVSLRYTASLLISGAESGEFAYLLAAARRRGSAAGVPTLGQLDLSGKFRFDGRSWEPVEQESTDQTERT